MGIRTLVWNDTNKLDAKARNAVMNFQESQGAEVDGYWGDWTTHRLNRSTGLYTMPDGGVFYNMPIRFAEPKDVKVFNPKGSLHGYNNAFTGGFSNQGGKCPISIMISDGEEIQGNSSHHPWGFPETLFYCTKDGELKWERVITYTQIKDDILWGISGLGLIDYDPEAEGFCKFTRENMYTGKIETKDFSDVLRYTWHSVYGIDQDGYVFGGLFLGTPEDIIKHCKENLNLTPIIMGDGGSWASCYTPDSKRNLQHVQYSAVQIGG